MPKRDYLLDAIVAAARGFQPGPLLDIPGGSGRVRLALTPLGFRVHGVDLFPSHPEAGVVCADMTRPLPFGDGSFVAAVSSEGIEHVSDSFGFLQELARVVRPGGGLVLTTPNVLNLRARVALALTGQVTFRTRVDEVTELVRRDGDRYYHGHVFLRSYFQLRYQLYHAGFRILGVRPTRTSSTAVLFSPLWPLVCLGTCCAFPPGGDTQQRQRHAEIRSHVLSRGALFSKNLVLVCRRIGVGPPP